MPDEHARNPVPEPFARMRGTFVVGLARSGTSLLKALLDGHPQVWAPPGESFASDWCAADEPAEACLAAERDLKLVEPGTPDFERFAAALRAAIDGPSDVAAGVLAWMTAAAAIDPPGAAARTWVEKTPKHLRQVPILLERLGAGTRVVCVVRDPRAVLASHGRRWQKTTPMHVRRLARRWALADALTDELAARHDQVLVVRYEDLVRDPPAVMRKVALHLGLPWDDVLAVPMRRGRPWGGNSSFGDAYAGVSPASLRRWTASLEPALVLELERLLGPRMEGRGYRPEFATPRGVSRWRRPVDGARRSWLGLWTRRRLADEHARWRAACDAS